MWPAKPFTHWRDYLSRPISRTTAGHLTYHCLTISAPLVLVSSAFHWFIQLLSKTLSRVCFLPGIFLHTRERAVNKTDAEYTYLEVLCVCVSVKGQAQSKDMNIEYLRWLTVLWMLPCNIREPSLIKLCSGRDLKEDREHDLCYSVHAIYWGRAYEAEEISSAKSLRNMSKILKFSKSLLQKRISYSPLTLYWSNYFLKYAFIKFPHKFTFKLYICWYNKLINIYLNYLAIYSMRLVTGFSLGNRNYCIEERSKYIVSKRPKHISPAYNSYGYSGSSVMSGAQSLFYFPSILRIFMYCSRYFISTFTIHTAWEGKMSRGKRASLPSPKSMTQRWHLLLPLTLL